MKVAEFLAENRFPIARVRPQTSVRELIERLRSDNVGAVIVSDGDGSLDGVVTDRDIARAAATHGEKLLDLPASALATTAAVSCSPHDQIADVARLMAERQIHHIPVMSDGRLRDVINIVEVLQERLRDRRRVTRAMAGMSLTAH